MARTIFIIPICHICVIGGGTSWVLVRNTIKILKVPPQKHYGKNRPPDKTSTKRIMEQSPYFDFLYLPKTENFDRKIREAIFIS